MKKTKFRKAMALLVAVLMVVMLTPFTGIALNDPTNQIGYEGGTKLYDEEKLIEGWEGPGVPDEAWVSVSKTIESAGAENQFIVTLDVRTRMNLDEDIVPGDASAILVLDMSGSMYSCATCGGGSNGSYGKHESTCVHYNDGVYFDTDGNSTTTASNNNDRRVGIVETRYYAVREAAKEFIETFAGLSDNAYRYVSIVVFGSSAVAQQIDGNYWINVATGAGKTAVLDYLSNLKAFTNNSQTAPDGYYTAVECGLAVARNLYYKTGAETDGRYLPTPPNGEIRNNNVILFTDGNPNRGGNSGTSVTGLSISSNGSHSLSNTQARAGEIKNGGSQRHSASFYGIAYAATNIATMRAIVNGTGGNGSDDGTNVYSATTQNLPIVFDSISKTITTWADAWVVEDPMGEHIVWSSSNTLADNQNIAVVGGVDTLVWDLKDVSGQKIVGGDYDGWFWYHYTYNITLDNLNGYDAGDIIPANGTTTLTYYIVEDGENLTDDPIVANFTIPTVFGYYAPFRFIKVDNANSPLPGAVFNLYLGDGTTLYKTATSSDTEGQLGLVDFGMLPSGHTYILREMSAPNDVFPDVFDYSVTVCYGDLDVSSASGTAYANGKFTNRLKEASILLEKAIEDDDTDIDKWDPLAEYTLTIRNDGDLPLVDVRVTDVLKTDANNVEVTSVTLNSAALTPDVDFLAVTSTGGFTMTFPAISETSPFMPGNVITIKYTVEYDKIINGSQADRGNTARACANSLYTSAAPHSSDSVDATQDSINSGFSITKRVYAATEGTAPDYYLAGDEVIYKIFIRNTGDFVIESITIGDSLAGDKIYSDASCADEYLVTFPQTIDLAPKNHVTYYAKYVVDADDVTAGTGTITNVATATVKYKGIVEPESKTDSADIPVEQPTLSIYKNIDNAPPSAAPNSAGYIEMAEGVNELMFTIRVVNNSGVVTAENVNVTDDFTVIKGMFESVVITDNVPGNLPLDNFGDLAARDYTIAPYGTLEIYVVVTVADNIWDAAIFEALEEFADWFAAKAVYDAAYDAYEAALDVFNAGLAAIDTTDMDAAKAAYDAALAVEETAYEDYIAAQNAYLALLSAAQTALDVYEAALADGEDATPPVIDTDAIEAARLADEAAWALYENAVQDAGEKAAAYNALADVYNAAVKALADVLAVSRAAFDAAEEALALEDAPEYEIDIPFAHFYQNTASVTCKWSPKPDAGSSTYDLREPVKVEVPPVRASMIAVDKVVILPDGTTTKLANLSADTTEINYQITVQNVGFATATGITIQDVFGNGSTLTVYYNGVPVDAPFDLAAGEIRVFTATVSGLPSNVGNFETRQYTNTVTVTAGEDQAESSAFAVIEADVYAEVTITKRARVDGSGDEFVRILNITGDDAVMFEFEITITNRGTGPALVTLTDTYGADGEITEFYVYEEGSRVPAGAEILLGAGETAVVYATLRVNSGVSVRNTASATYKANDNAEETTVDDSAFVTVNPVAKPAFIVEKDVVEEGYETGAGVVYKVVDNPVYYADHGEEVTMIFRVIVSNVGTAGGTVSLSDLPDTAGLASDGVTFGYFEGGDFIAYANGTEFTLAPQASLIFYYTITVTADGNAAQVRNTATITSEDPILIGEDEAVVRIRPRGAVTVDVRKYVRDANGVWQDVSATFTTSTGSASVTFRIVVSVDESQVGDLEYLYIYGMVEDIYYNGGDDLTYELYKRFNPDSEEYDLQLSYIVAEYTITISRDTVNTATLIREGMEIEIDNEYKVVLGGPDSAEAIIRVNTPYVPGNRNPNPTVIIEENEPPLVVFPIVIEEEEIPLGEYDQEEEEEEETEVEEEEVYIEDDGDVVELEEDDVPLGEMPRTGIVDTFPLWIFSLCAAMVGVIVLAVIIKKTGKDVHYT